MSEKEFVKVTEDQLAVINREAKKLFSSLGTMVNMLNEKKLDSESVDMFMKLVHFHIDDISKAIGFTGKETDREKEIRELGLKVRDDEIAQLRKAIGNKTPGAIASTIAMLNEKINKWWKVEGFNYLREFSILKNGAIEVGLGFSLYNFVENYSDTPVSDSENRLSKIDELKRQGYELAEKKGDGIYLIDNDANRTLLERNIKQAFPSAKIHRFENRPTREGLVVGDKPMTTRFEVTSVIVVIKEIDDVHNLTIRDVSFFGEDDE